MQLDLQGLDTASWRRLCTSFKSASIDLCHSLAITTQRLYMKFVDPSAIAPFLACRLIALNKNPGVRPIGIGDTTRWIIAKAILIVTRLDIQKTAGSLQLCASQISGIEAAVHAVNSLFQQEETEAILLVDDSNAFNSLNCLSALHNIRQLCPSLATALINSYRAPTEVFVDGDVLYSSEGTTQGDPLATLMYALATIPLVEKLHCHLGDVSQVWYADDASAVGKIDRLQEWWSQLISQGPKFSYFPNATKTWLVTKEKHHATATTFFANMGVHVTSEGRPYLGAALGTEDFVISHVKDSVAKWTKELDSLAAIALSQSHAAHAAFTHGLSSKWFYLTRTIQGIGPLLQPLETIMRSKLIPALTGQPPPSDEMCDLLALPARLGGIALTNPTSTAEVEFPASTKVSDPLKDAILQQCFEYPGNITHEQVEAKGKVRRMKHERSIQAADSVKQSLPPSLQRSMDLAQEIGSSIWLISLPIQEFGFALHKRAFQDALAFRYNWQPLQAPLLVLVV